MRKETETLEKSIRAVRENEWLLVFPIPNKKEPKSLWHVLHPKSVMKWEWNESGDDKVVKLWHLRRLLAESHRVIYSKWYRGRATLFSESLFKKLWVFFGPARLRIAGEGREIVELLEMESPLSTKQIRRGVELTGRDNEKRYVASMKELWRTFAIVGVGEIDDGAFPSLAHAATPVIFEELCNAAERENTFEEARAWLDCNIADKTFRRWLGSDLTGESRDVESASPAISASSIAESRKLRD